MKSERIILSFIAVLVGLMAAGGTYFIYQHYVKSSNKSSVLNAAVKQITPTQTPRNSNDYLIIQNPSDEMVTDSRSLQVNGKATKDSTIIVSTPSTDQVAIASADGSFSLTTTLDDDTNILQITAIFPDGSEQKTLKTVTYSTEDF
ncbi:MAG TPA: hypothetical protein VMR41_04670 [Patescibacteria group bacterium]|nr:hypothetical protein [Patescibacteria group bacterium]